jgi:hypothetical protein
MRMIGKKNPFFIGSEYIFVEDTNGNYNVYLEDSYITKISKSIMEFYFETTEEYRENRIKKILE